MNLRGKCGNTSGPSELRKNQRVCRSREDESDGNEGLVRAPVRVENLAEDEFRYQCEALYEDPVFKLFEIEFFGFGSRLFLVLDKSAEEKEEHFRAESRFELELRDQQRQSLKSLVLKFQRKGQKVQELRVHQQLLGLVHFELVGGLRYPGRCPCCRRSNCR